MVFLIANEGFGYQTVKKARNRTLTVLKKADSYPLSSRGLMASWFYNWYAPKDRLAKWSPFLTVSWQFPRLDGPREITHKQGFPKSTLDKGAWEIFMSSSSSGQIRAPYLSAIERRLMNSQICFLYLYSLEAILWITNIYDVSKIKPKY